MYLVARVAREQAASQTARQTYGQKPWYIVGTYYHSSLTSNAWGDQYPKRHFRCSMMIVQLNKACRVAILGLLLYLPELDGGRYLADF